MTKRELEIMEFLWNSPKSMTASEIASSVHNMTSNTAQTILRKMLRNGLIKIEKIVYSHTVLCRSFLPAFTKEDYLLVKFAYDYHNTGKHTLKTSVVCNLLNSELTDKGHQNELTQLKKILNDYEKKLEENKTNKT